MKFRPVIISFVFLSLCACKQKVSQQQMLATNEDRLASFAQNARLQRESASTLGKTELREHLQNNLRQLAFDSLKTIDDMKLYLSPAESQIFASDTVITATGGQSRDIVYLVSNRYSPGGNMYADAAYKSFAAIDPNTSIYSVSGKIIGASIQTVPSNRLVVTIEPNEIKKTYRAQRRALRLPNF